MGQVRARQGMLRDSRGSACHGANNGKNCVFDQEEAEERTT